MCKNCKYVLRDQISDLVCGNKKCKYYNNYVEDKNIKNCQHFKPLRKDK